MKRPYCLVLPKTACSPFPVITSSIPRVYVDKKRWTLTQ